MARVRQDLVDGGHVILKCSACGKELIDIWKIKPEPRSIKVVALCCYCNDKSFEEEIEGRLVINGIAKANPNDPEDFLSVTKWAGSVEKDGIFFLSTVKA